MDSATERDDLVAEDYVKHNLSAQKLALKYNLSIPAIRRIIAAKGVQRGPQTVPEIGVKVLDESHRILGMKLYFHRVTKKFDDTVKAGEKLGWSTKKLRNIEQGYTLLTLPDLINMAQYLNISLPSMLMDLTDNSTDKVI